MNIRTKLLLGYLSIAVLVGIIVIIAVFTINEIENQFDVVNKEILPIIEVLEELEINGLQISYSATDIGLMITELQKAKKSKEEIAKKLEEEEKESGKEEYKKALQTLEKLAAQFSPEYDSFLKKITQLGKELIQKSDAFIQLKKEGISGEIIIEAEEKLEEQVQLFRKTTQEMLLHEKKESKELHEILHEYILGAINLFVLSGILAFFLAIILGVLIAQGISAPLIHLTHAVIEVGKAKFDTRVDTSPTGEVGILARTFNQMAIDLSRTTVSKNYFESIVNSMNNSLIVLTPEGKIRELNHMTCYLLGYQVDELMGESFDIVIDKEKFFPETSADSLSFLGFVNNVEIEYVTKTGEKIPVMFSGSTMDSDNGEIGGYVCVAQNITELKRLQEKLKKSKQKSRLSGFFLKRNQ